MHVVFVLPQCSRPREWANHTAAPARNAGSQIDPAAFTTARGTFQPFFGRISCVIRPRSAKRRPLRCHKMRFRSVRRRPGGLCSRRFDYIWRSRESAVEPGHDLSQYVRRDGGLLSRAGRWAGAHPRRASCAATSATGSCAASSSRAGMSSASFTRTSPTRRIRTSMSSWSCCGFRIRRALTESPRAQAGAARDRAPRRAALPRGLGLRIESATEKDAQGKPTVKDIGSTAS